MKSLETEGTNPLEEQSKLIADALCWKPKSLEEVLKKVKLNQDEIEEIVWDSIQTHLQKYTRFKSEEARDEVESILYGVEKIASKAIANSPDVIRVEEL